LVPVCFTKLTSNLSVAFAWQQKKIGTTCQTLRLKEAEFRLEHARGHAHRSFSNFLFRP